MNDPLNQLRDIQLPEPIGWWPIAPGWWLIALSICLTLWGVYVIALRRKRRSLPKKCALRALDTCYVRFKESSDSGTFLREINHVLKQYAVHHVDARANRFSGKPWLRFLDTQMDGDDFSIGAGQCLADGPYAQGSPVDAPALLDLSKRWVRHVA